MSTYKKPVAFACHDGDEAWTVVHAISHSQARHFASNEIGCDFISIESCRRVPFADGLHGDDLNRAMVEHGGWRYECNQCGEEVSTDTCNITEIVYRRDLVFCSKACCADFDAERENERLEKEATTAAVLKEFPGADVRWTSGNRASFLLPGMKRAVDWVIGDETVTMVSEAVDSYQAYKARREAGEFSEAAQ